MAYELEPRYPVVGGGVEVGFDPLAADVRRTAPSVLAVDGPAALDWGTFVLRLVAAIERLGLRARAVDVRGQMLPWSEIERRTEREPLRCDPVFAAVFEGELASLFATPPEAPASTSADVTIVFGPGSALARHDRLWYADLPKRLALAATEAGRARNLGQPADAGGTPRRLMFIDWPTQDRHQRASLERWHRYVNAGDPHAPRSLDAEALRRSLRALARGPFRTRPTFLPQPWGGQWLRRVLGATTSEPNLGLGYELVSPESGILFGERGELEVGFEVLLAEAGTDVLGREVRARFGGSFPIRFDYLDTIGGGDLSVHCHPREHYMREVFGLPHAQHESYYVMVTEPGAVIFLGLREDLDPERFRVEAERSQASGSPLEIERFVQTFPASRHDLFLIPAGTPHASGEGNVVLEISATPYLYSLRLYDWLRADLDGRLRPVQLQHAFANVDLARRGPAVRDQLVPTPRVLRRGAGFAELELGRHPDLFFAVHRLDFRTQATDDTNGRFHVLNLVEGDEVLVRTAGGSEHRLGYAETLIMPATAGAYTLRAIRGGRSRVVKAFVV